MNSKCKSTVRNVVEITQFHMNQLDHLPAAKAAEIAAIRKAVGKKLHTVTKKMRTPKHAANPDVRSEYALLKDRQAKVNHAIDM